MSAATMRPKEPASDSIDAPSGAAPLTIRRLEPGDAIRDALVDLHREALPGDVLPALGKPFLKSYFESVLSDESQHVVGALVGDELVGFCQLSLRPVGIGTVLRSRPRTMLSVVRAVLFKPVVFFRGFLLAVRRSSPAPGPEISLVAVKPRYQRRGIGTQLAKGAMAISAQRGFDRIHTKTANAAARALYERDFGASISDDYVVLGQRYWCLSWDCGSGRAGPARDV